MLFAACRPTLIRWCPPAHWSTAPPAARTRNRSQSSMYESHVSGCQLARVNVLNAHLTPSAVSPFSTTGLRET